jgi:CHAD domain-containing protein/CYTH domain-containing protein
MQLPSDLLDRPPEEAARLLGLSFLDEATEARKRLAEGDEGEALHDFRVGLRRLRSSLRAYRRWLQGSVSRALLDELGDMASSTNAGRDAEVALEWLAAQRSELNARQRAGLSWQMVRLEAQRQESYSGVLSRVSDFDRLEKRLRKHLAAYATRVQVEHPQLASPFATVVAPLIEEHAADLQASLAEVKTAEDEDEAHRARIRGKRLRYLLEPLQGPAPEAKGLIKRLKSLQDLLGELHDTSVLAEEVVAGLEQAAAEKARRLHALTLSDVDPAEMRAALRRDERPGLLALARLLRQRRERLFSELEQEWLSGGIDAFTAEVRDFARELGASHRTQEVERKFLLRGLPDALRETEPVEIWQGYLPGKRLQERLRRTRGPKGERCYRTVKAGAGLQRIELEEEAPPDLFEALWPLTEGRRVCKRRFAMEDAGHTWEIDEFTDRPLFLAEVELSDEDDEAALPEWLAPWVEREVTGEDEYLNVNLAG